MTSACPICGKVHDGRRDEPARATVIDPSRVGSTRRDAVAPDIAVCRGCGLGWQTSPPRSDELVAAYQGMRDEAYLAEASNRRKASKPSLRLLRRHAGSASRTLLDVGCSAGFFLEAALADGWDAWGVEPSEYMSTHARRRLGERVFTATLEAAPLEGRRFDAVTMWDVLEHVPDPAAFVAEAKRKLVPGGILAINVPARDTLVAGLLGRRWPLILPEHLFYFSRASLRLLLERAGFEVLGFHAHRVYFSTGYVLRSLSQRGWPAARIERALSLVRAGDLSVPLLMGERSVIARLRTAATS